ncbi:hypothetical protein JL720_11636 [Aureococcus anophagefferens]|nr:hypothetical protein JL720_11636 [Aureococcus anophagefferens]
MFENAIDAGARTIAVSVAEGGVKLLRVSDDARARKADLAALRAPRDVQALTFEDLQSIQSFGFRGEALASISHVAKLSILTKTRDGVRRCAYRDGEPVDGPTPCAGADGTTITVEDLFYNMPTRRRAMASSPRTSTARSRLRRLRDPLRGPRRVRELPQAHGACDVNVAGGDTLAAIRDDGGEHACEFACRGFVSRRAREHSTLGATPTARRREAVHASSTTASSSPRPSSAWSTRPTRRRPTPPTAWEPGQGKPFAYLAIDVPGTTSTPTHPTKKEVAFLYEAPILDTIRCHLEKLVAETAHEMRIADLSDRKLTASPKRRKTSGGSQSSRRARCRRRAAPSQPRKEPSLSQRPEKMIRTDPRDQRMDAFFSPSQRKRAAAAAQHEPLAPPSQDDDDDDYAPPPPPPDAESSPADDDDDGAAPSPASPAAGGRGADRPPAALPPLAEQVVVAPGRRRAAAVDAGDRAAVVGQRRRRRRAGGRRRRRRRRGARRAGGDGDDDAEAAPKRLRRRAAPAPDEAPELTGENLATVPGAFSFAYEQLAKGTQMCECGAVVSADGGLLKQYELAVRRPRASTSASSSTRSARRPGVQSAEAMRQHVLVGHYDAHWTIIQHGTHLALANTGALSVELFYQLAIRQFGEAPTIEFDPPGDLAFLMAAHLRSEEPDRTEASAAADAAKAAATLGSKAAMLEYFSVKIDAEKGLLLGMPELLREYVPEPSAIPRFLWVLANDTEWRYEKACFENVARALGTCYATLPSDDADEKVLNERAEAVLKTSILPALKTLLLPPEDLADADAVIKLTSLERMYRVFERC